MMPTSHLAIFNQPFINLILDGYKTIETRTSKIKIPPHQSVVVGDHVLMKQSGGPIKGAFEITRIESFCAETQLDGKDFDAICQERAYQIFGLPKVKNEFHKDFREKWCRSKYATFIHVVNVRHYDPVVKIKKTNRQAWVVLGNGTAEEWVKSF